MSLARYLRDRRALLLGMGTGMASAGAVLAALWISWQAIAFVEVILALSFLIPLGLDWAARRRLCRQVEEALESSESLWLLPNALEEPAFREGELLREGLVRVARDRADQIADARRENREYREYVETWVHEIKTPLASARLLLANHPGPLAEELEEELFRLDSYVEQALYYARSGSAEQDYLIRELSLAGTVRSALRRYARPLIAAGFRVELEDWDAAVYTDPKWLEFILGQIIANAVAYRGERPVLSFTCAQEGEAVRLTVSDNGPGIPAEDLPRIFEKGFTGRNGRKGAKRSTGLGLYLCRKLCRKLGLEITAASTPGAGTEITLWIPRGEFSRVAHPQGLEDRL